MTAGRTFRLRSSDADIALTAGRFFIGRGRDCQLVLDDPLVSRRHAVVFADGDRVTVEDLSSRNGTLVNGERIEAPTVLSAGDRVSIGAHQLVLERGQLPRERRATGAQGHPLPSGAYRRPPTTVRPPAPVEEATRAASVFDVLLAAIDHALDRSNLPDAEIAAGNLVVSIRAALLRSHGPGDHVMNELVAVTLRLAELTGSGRWIDRLLEVFGSAQRVLDAETIERIHGVVAREGLAIDQSLRGYLARVRLLSAGLDDDEMRRLARLEALAS